jgi:hypothetical protein
VDRRSKTHTNRGEKCTGTENIPFEFHTFPREDAGQPKIIRTFCIHKSQNFIFLEDLYQK